MTAKELESGLDTEDFKKVSSHREVESYYSYIQTHVMSV